MNVEVYLTASSATEDDLKGKSVIVVDVLRACSTIVTALNHGARAVIPVADMAEASRIGAHMGTTSLLGGERSGTKIDGYALGNSPEEYTPEAVQGKTVVLNTSNGTRAVTQARGAAEIAIGCFLNVSKVIEFAWKAEHEVVILCAGSDDRVALEDILCAGLILNQLWSDGEHHERSDAAHIALSLYAYDKDDLTNALMRSNHAQRLIELGFEDDVRYCARVDALPLLPIYRDSRLVLADPSAAAYSSKTVPSEAPTET
ncbi:MAG: 2-phosphosulfolactate phosphatase [Rhodothermales bacterium]